MSKDVGLWGKFNYALECLDDTFKTTSRQYADYKGLVSLASIMLKKAHKIYFPTDRRILTGRKIDADIAQLIKIPYPVTAILSETFVAMAEGQTEGYRSYSLSIVLDPQASELDEFVPETFREHLNGTELLFLSLTETPKTDDPELSGKTGFWVMYPMMYVARFEDGNGYVLRGYPARNVPGADKVLDDGLHDFDTILNTCALLNLENVVTETHKAPVALNNARVKRGKQPYYDYKILVVDNERWDSSSGKRSHSEHDGVRSHFRRGHIRRLETGKAVWVRHTIVHGSKEGFVEKSYSLDPKHAVHKVPTSI